jgi:hypothetical protein
VIFIGRESPSDSSFNRLTSDIYPGDLGWSVQWDKPEERQEWYHNMSSVLQAGPCVRSNQLDYDEDVVYKVRSCPPSAFSLHMVRLHIVLHQRVVVGFVISAWLT